MFLTLAGMREHRRWCHRPQFSNIRWRFKGKVSAQCSFLLLSL